MKLFTSLLCGNAQCLLVTGKLGIRDAAEHSEHMMQEKSMSVPSSIQGSETTMCFTGGNTVEDAKKSADDATSAAKSAVPDEPKDATKDAVAAIKSIIPGKPCNLITCPSVMLRVF